MLTPSIQSGRHGQDLTTSTKQSRLVSSVLQSIGQALVLPPNSPGMDKRLLFFHSAQNIKLNSSLEEPLFRP